MAGLRRTGRIGRGTRAGFDVPAEARATFADLSPAAERFLDWLAEHPAATRHVDYRSRLPRWLRKRVHPMQTWPTLIAEAKLQRLRRAVEGVVGLVMSIPQRVFRGDPGRISKFYGLRDEGAVARMLRPPNGIRSAVARCDLVDTGDALKVLEVNMAGKIGGFDISIWEPKCRENRALAQFFAAEGIEPVHRDPFRALLAHVIRDTRRRSLVTAGELNVALGIEPVYRLFMVPMIRTLRAAYREQLAATDPQLTGTLVAVPYPRAAGGLSVRSDAVYYRKRRIHAVLESVVEDTPEDIYERFKAGCLSLYNGPMDRPLSDKRNLAVLSEHQDSDLFDARERALIHDHVPWSRQVVDHETSFRGANVSLAALLASHREELVLKPAQGLQGEGVAVGRFTTPTRWRRLVRTALADATWVVQEYCPSRPYPYQLGDQGVGLHDVVWSLFCTGCSYGGGYLRIMPRGVGSGVVNVARGAVRGFMYEV